MVVAAVMQLVLLSMAVLQVSGLLRVSCSFRLFQSNAAEINYGRDSKDLTPDMKVYTLHNRKWALHICIILKHP